MKSKLPLVSICIPIYNGEKFLEEAILSANAQSYKNIEIICVDNKSTDGTNAILKRLEKNISKLKIFRNNSTVAMWDNFNLTLDHANGEYIKFLCADDLLHEHCLEKYVRVMETNPDVGLVTCRDHRIDELGSTLNSKHPLSADEKLNGEIVINRMFELGSGTYCKTPTHVMIRNLNPKFIFRTKSGWGVDTYKWMEILTSSNYQFVNKDLVSNRVHKASYSASEATENVSLTIQGYYDFFVSFYLDNKKMVSKLVISKFKRKMIQRLTENNMLINSLNDWNYIFSD